MRLAICLYSILTFLLIFKVDSISAAGNIYTTSAGNKFYIDSERKSVWIEALISCMERNMTLVTIGTEEKSNEINQLVKSSFGGNKRLWVGGIMSRYPQRQYIWLSTGKKFNYTFWSSGNPNFESNLQHCIEIGFDTNMEWNDYSCNEKNGFICEPNQQYLENEKLKYQIQQELEKQQKINVDIQEREKREKILQQELESVEATLKQQEEKYFQDEKKLTQDLENYQNKFRNLEENKEKLEKKLEILEETQQLKNKKNPYNILHFHQDRYTANELYQN